MKDSLYEAKSLIARMYNIEGNEVYCEMLNEDRASKQSDKARRVIMNIFGDKYKWNEPYGDSGKNIINEFEEYLRQNMHIKSKSHPESNVSYEFEPGIARICYGELNLNPYNNNAYWRLMTCFRETMEYISLNNPKEYDENLNGYSLSHFVEKYGQFFEKEFKNDDDIIEKRVKNYKYGFYTINQIDSFSEANEYKRFFDDNPKDLWCITKEMKFFNMYSSSFKNKIYFCTVDNFGGIAPEKGENYPYDRYGMSMICVIVNKEKKPVVITLRWNHHDGAPGDNGFLLDKTVFMRKTGIVFDSVFTPYSDEETKLLIEKFLPKKDGINEDEYYSFLKTGDIGCDEVEDFNDDYKIAYAHKDFIYYNEAYDDWYYVDPTDSPEYNFDDEDEDQEDMPADFIDCSVAYVIDKKNKKIIYKLNQTYNMLFRFKNNFFVLNNGELFSSSKKTVIANNVISATCFNHLLIIRKNNGTFCVLDGLTGEYLTKEEFKNYYITGRRNLCVFHNDKHVMFASTEQEKVNGLMIPMDDFIGKVQECMFFIKDGKTCIFHPFLNQYKEINRIYDKVKDNSLYNEFILSNEISDEAVLVKVTNEGVNISNPVYGPHKLKVVSVLDKNRYVFMNERGEYNVFNLTTNSCEFKENFHLKRIDVHYPLKVLSFRDSNRNNPYCPNHHYYHYCLYNDDITKKVYESDEEIRIIASHRKYTLFNVDNNYYLYDNVREEILKNIQVVDCADVYLKPFVTIKPKTGKKESKLNLETGETKEIN